MVWEYKQFALNDISQKTHIQKNKFLEYHNIAEESNWMKCIKTFTFHKCLAEEEYFYS